MSRLYHLLKVDLHASQAEIRQAYLKLAMRYHPDRNLGDKVAEARFKDVVSAFEILGDREARALYDQGRIDEKGRPCPGYSGSEFAKNRDEARQMWHNAASIFAREFFQKDKSSDEGDDASFEGDVHSPPPPPPGNDEGAGQKSEAEPPLCSETRVKQYRLSINFAEACLGTVKHVRLPNKAQFKISVPPGVETGQKLRVNSTADGAGPFVVKITVEPHVLFERDERDIVMELPVTPYEAFFGLEVDVPTLHGPAKITVPAEALDGDEIIMPGMGVRPKGQSAGDQRVCLKFAMPRRWAGEFEAAMKSWKQKAPYNPRGKLLKLMTK